MKKLNDQQREIIKNKVEEILKPGGWKVVGFEDSWLMTSSSQKIGGPKNIKKDMVQEIDIKRDDHNKILTLKLGDTIDDLGQAIWIACNDFVTHDDSISERERNLILENLYSKNDE